MRSKTTKKSRKTLKMQARRLRFLADFGVASGAGIRDSRLILGHLNRHGAYQFIKVVRHIWAVEGHYSGFITAQMIVAGRNDVPDIIAVEAGDNRARTSCAEEIFDAQRQLATEIARSGNPEGVVQAKGLDEASVGVVKQVGS